MEEALTDFLLADAGVAAAIGAELHWSGRPQGSPLPAIVLRVISGAPEYHDHGQANLEENRVQAECLALTIGEAKAAARAFRAAFDDNNSFQRLGIDFQAVDIEDARDAGLAPAQGGETVHSVQVDLLIWHSKGV